MITAFKLFFLFVFGVSTPIYSAGTATLPTQYNQSEANIGIGKNINTSNSDSSATNRDQWRDILKWDASCDEFFPQNIEAGSYLDVSPHSISPSEQIIYVICNVAAYQESGIVYYYNSDTQQAKQLSFEYIFQDNELSPTSITTQELTGVTIDADHQLTSFAKGRGIGDCGNISSYSWNQNSKSYEVAEVREQVCTSQLVPNSASPESWPIIYQ